MMPVLFRFPDWVPLVGEQAVTSFGVVMFAALVLGGALFARRMAARGFARDAGWDLVAMAAVGGILGAKLYYLLLHAPDLRADPIGALAARGGLVWYGGLLGGAGAVLWRARRLGLPLPTLADAAAPALALGYALGRIGCFLVGDDYGLPTASWAGVAFPEGAPPTTPANLLEYFGVVVPPALATGDFVAVHPTQLYEAGLSLLVLAALLGWERSVSRRYGAAPGSGADWTRGGTPTAGTGTGTGTPPRAFLPGALFALWLVLAGLERFAVEFFRAKDDVLPLGLTLAQLISLGAALAGIVLLRLLRDRPAPATPAVEAAW